MKVDEIKNRFKFPKFPIENFLSKHNVVYRTFVSFFNNDIEKKFFLIVRKFSLFITTVSVIAVSILLLLSFLGYLSTPDTHISNPHVVYNDLKKELQEKYNRQYDDSNKSLSSTEEKELKLAEAQRELEYEKEFDKYFQLIISDLNEFAKITGDKPVSKYEDRLRRKLLKTSKELGFEWLEEFGEFISDLKDDAKAIAKLSEGDSRKISWLESVEWFFDEHDAQVSKEEERVERETKESINDKVIATEYLIIAGAVFSIFMFFVLILVLIRIEINTRALNKN
jgi:hypothetical protein